VAEPRVSVVVIFCDQERYLADAIDSVLAQDFADFELLLADDGSSDGSTDIAQGYVARHPGKVIYLEHRGHANRGSSATRNLGLLHARGELVCWLDGDDRLRPGTLTEQVALLDAHPAAGMVCGGHMRWRSWQGGADQVLLAGPREGLSLPPQTALEVYPLGWAAGPTQATARRPLALALGGFEEDFPGLYDDQTFYAKMFLAAPTVFSDRIWLDYRRHEASCTAQATWRDYVAVRGRFLEWLDAYLATHDVAGKEHIRRVVSRERARLRQPLIVRRLFWRLHRLRLWVLRLAGFEERYRRDRSST
jgi:glycosyltransferase involved in cell wall biosynthesis